MDFKDPPLVEREDLPLEMQPQNQKFGKVKHFFNNLTMSPMVTQKPKFNPVSKSAIVPSANELNRSNPQTLENIETKSVSWVILVILIYKWEQVSKSLFLDDLLWSFFLGRWLVQATVVFAPHALVNQGEGVGADLTESLVVATLVGIQEISNVHVQYSLRDELIHPLMVVFELGDGLVLLS